MNENDLKNLKEQLGDCIYSIQFGKMTNDEVGGILNNNMYADMFDQDELLEIVCKSLVRNYVPKIFGKSTRINLLFPNNKNPELVERRNLSPFRKQRNYTLHIEYIAFIGQNQFLFE